MDVLRILCQLEHVCPVLLGVPSLDFSALANLGNLLVAGAMCTAKVLIEPIGTMPMLPTACELRSITAARH